MALPSAASGPPLDVDPAAPDPCELLRLVELAMFDDVGEPEVVEDELFFGCEYAAGQARVTVYVTKNIGSDPTSGEIIDIDIDGRTAVGSAFGPPAELTTVFVEIDLESTDTSVVAVQYLGPEEAATVEQAVEDVWDLATPVEEKLPG